MSLKDKLIDCKYLFENNFKQSLSYLYYHFKTLKLETFQNHFVINIPYVNIENESVNVKWD